MALSALRGSRLVTAVHINVLQTADALVQVAADRFVALATDSIRECGRFHVALSGGTTPRSLYAMLATDRYAARVDWSRVHVCWGDERCVPPAGPPMRGAGFDLVLLGMGTDGHTASLFPWSTAISEPERWAMPAYVADVSTSRVTCTPVLFNMAAAVVFLVVGSGKAATLREVLEGPHQPLRLPAQAIAPRDGSVSWLLDADAAAHLTLAGYP